jgi:hypothetical protein
MWSRVSCTAGVRSAVVAGPREAMRGRRESIRAYVQWLNDFLGAPVAARGNGGGAGALPAYRKALVGQSQMESGSFISAVLLATFVHPPPNY